MTNEPAPTTTAPDQNVSVMPEGLDLGPIEMTVENLDLWYGDAQALKGSRAAVTVQLGKKLTRGLGAGEQRIDGDRVDHRGRPVGGRRTGRQLPLHGGADADHGRGVDPVHPGELVVERSRRVERRCVRDRTVREQADDQQLIAAEEFTQLGVRDTHRRVVGEHVLGVRVDLDEHEARGEQHRDRPDDGEHLARRTDREMDEAEREAAQTAGRGGVLRHGR